jgi:hypothetical protein
MCLEGHANRFFVEIYTNLRDKVFPFSKFEYESAQT